MEQSPQKYINFKDFLSDKLKKSKNGDNLKGNLRAKPKFSFYLFIPLAVLGILPGLIYLIFFSSLTHIYWANWKKQIIESLPDINELYGKYFDYEVQNKNIKFSSFDSSEKNGFVMKLKYKEQDYAYVESLEAAIGIPETSIPIQAIDFAGFGNDNNVFLCSEHFELTVPDKYFSSLPIKIDYRTILSSKANRWESESIGFNEKYIVYSQDKMAAAMLLTPRKIDHMVREDLEFTPLLISSDLMSWSQIQRIEEDEFNNIKSSIFTGLKNVNFKKPISEITELINKKIKYTVNMALQPLNSVSFLID